MRFASVTDSSRSTTSTLAEATLLGWAPDGGMFWPCTIPAMEQHTIRRLSRLSYQELCCHFLQLFTDELDPDLSHADLVPIVRGAFSAFGCAEVVRLNSLTSAADPDEPVHIGELWHGPTLAFKDLGMTVLGRVLSHLLARRDDRITLLVGTSGDTGSSAMEAVRDLPRIELLVLYPLPQFSSITAVQERQMTSVAEAAENVHLIGVEGSSDDLDVPIEALFRVQSALPCSKHATIRSRMAGMLFGHRTPNSRRPTDWAPSTQSM